MFKTGRMHLVAKSLSQIVKPPYWSFFSGIGIIKANMVFNYDAALGGGDNYDFTLDYNDVEIIKVETTGPTVSPGPIIQFREVIIPPLTHVVISAINKNGSTDHDCYAMINGRVYGAE